VLVAEDELVDVEAAAAGAAAGMLPGVVTGAMLGLIWVDVGLGAPTRFGDEKAPK
jgi:hypothetical protein